jgi:hypothetical protein
MCGSNCLELSKLFSTATATAVIETSYIRFRVSSLLQFVCNWLTLSILATTRLSFFLDKMVQVGV